MALLSKHVDVGRCEILIGQTWYDRRWDRFGQQPYPGSRPKPFQKHDFMQVAGSRLWWVA